MLVKDSQRENFTLLALFLLSNSLNFIFPLLAPILMSTSMLDTKWVPLIQALMYSFTAVIQPQLGRMLDRGNIRLTTLIAAIFLASGLTIIFVSGFTGWFAVLASFLFITATGTVSMMVSRTLVATLGDDERPRMGAIIHMLENIGISCSAVIAYFALKECRIHLITADAITTIILLFGLAVALSKISAKSSVTATSFAENFTTSTHATLKNKRALCAIGAVVMLFAVVTAQLSAIPMLLNKVGMDVERMMSFIFFMSAATTALAAWFSYRHKSIFPKYFQVGALLMTLGHVLLPFVSGLPAIAFCCIAWSIGEAILLPWTISQFYAAFSKDHSGYASGVLVMARRSAFVLSALVAALLSVLPTASFAIIFGLFSIAVVPLLKVSTAKPGDLI